MDKDDVTIFNNNNKNNSNYLVTNSNKQLLKFTIIVTIRVTDSN